MVPVKLPVYVNGEQLGTFVRDSAGACRVLGSDKLSSTRRALLNLFGQVLADTVAPCGRLPSDEEVLVNVVRIGVPVHVLAPLFAWPNEAIARMLNVLPAMVQYRREMIVGHEGPGRLPLPVLGGGDA